MMMVKLLHDFWQINLFEDYFPVVQIEGLNQVISKFPTSTKRFLSKKYDTDVPIPHI